MKVTMWWPFKVKWVVLWSLWLARVVRQPTVEVRVSGGWLRGSVAPAGTHVQYLGVPYATVTRRFQAPGPEPSWEGVLDANDEHIRCIQRYTRTTLSGREDCLTLNVYTPLEQSPGPRPVMVFIHGGGFRDGSGSPILYGSQYLTRKDVILVTFNYRVEILGFLCLGIDEAPGNAGMKDQVAALKWVKRNIKAFGGDPDNITIFGESAGSASVMYHLMSPMSIGLFQRAILQSGSAISPWSFQYEPLETASRLALQMGHNTSDPYEIHKIFVNKTAEELLWTRVPRNDGDIVISENIFVPCVEKKLNDVEPFLTDTPFNLLSKGLYLNAPLIMGFNSAEGYMFVAKENDTTIAKLNFYGAMPRDLTFHTDDEKKKTAETLKQLYMGDEAINKSTLIRFSRYVGDSQIIYPVVAAAEMIAKTSNNPLWLYRFDHSGWMNIAKKYFGYGAAPGATHADELFYIFKIAIPVLLHEYMERDMIEKMTTMWTNFAKYGEPTPRASPSLPKWGALDKRDPRLLVIDKQFSTAPLWADDALRFWNATYTQYRRKDVSAF